MRHIRPNAATHILRPFAAALIVALTTGLGANAVQASSDDAWSAFAKEVQAACSKAASGSIVKPRAVVDPFGSQSYGMALVTGQPNMGKAKPAKGKPVADISLICVYDKKTKRAEVGSELNASQVIVKPTR